MSIRTLKTRLAYCFQAETEIKRAKGKQLEVIKDNLADKMGLPIGFHTMGLPLALSMLGIILSFSIPQFALWSAIFSWLQLPGQARPARASSCLCYCVSFCGYQCGDCLYDW